MSVFKSHLGSGRCSLEDALFVHDDRPNHTHDGFYDGNTANISHSIKVTIDKVLQSCVPLLSVQHLLQTSPAPTQRLLT